jgi:CDGSH-type Zn-finger protein
VQVTWRGGFLQVVADPSMSQVPAFYLPEVTNVATGLTRPAKTSEDGSYRFSALPVGTYDIRAEQPGFQTKVGAIQFTHRISLNKQRVLICSCNASPLAGFCDASSHSATGSEIDLTADARMTNARHFFAIRKTHQHNC